MKEINTKAELAVVSGGGICTCDNKDGTVWNSTSYSSEEECKVDCCDDDKGKKYKYNSRTESHKYAFCPGVNA